MVQMKIKPKEEFTPKQAETESEVDELDEKPDITEFAQEVDAIEEKPLKPSKKRGRSVHSQSSEEDPPKPNKKKQRGAGEMGEGGKKMGNWSSDEDWAMFCTIFPKPTQNRFRVLPTLLESLIRGSSNPFQKNGSSSITVDADGKRKGPWAAVEDGQLFTATYGNIDRVVDWTAVTKVVPGRDGQSAQNRYRNMKRQLKTSLLI